MRTSFVLTLAMAAATLGTAPMAQAQMAPGHARDDYRHGDPRDDHRGDRQSNRQGPERGPQASVSRDERMRMRTSIRDLRNDIARAQQTHRIGAGQASGLRGEMRDLERRYSSRLDGGLNRSEYASLAGSVAHVRGQLDAFTRHGDRRPG